MVFVCYNSHMNSNPWSMQRKVVYLSIVLSVLFVGLVVPLVFFLKQDPTCFDGKKNGDEVDVDCGGTCELLCSFDRLQPIIVWSRAFPVVSGVYSAVAYIQNPNLGTEALGTYTFRLYDAQGALIATRQNTTFIPKNKAIAVFEPNVSVVSGSTTTVPARVTFEFTGETLWRKNLAPSPEIAVSKNILTQADTSPRVDADVTNKTSERLQRVEVVAIVYNDQGNAIGASRTFVDELLPGETKHVVFTWAEPLIALGSTPPSVVEVIPRVVPRSW